MKRLKWRRVVSLSLLLLAAVLTYTGFVLYIAPQGRIAYWSDWHFLGLDKDQLGAIHTSSAFAFALLGWLHTLYNWKAIVRYLKNASQQLRVTTPEVIVTSALVAVIVAGSGLSLPPFAQVMETGEAIKAWWEEREGSPPYGHAELASLATVADKLGLETEAALEALRDAGWTVDDVELSLLHVSRDNEGSPADIYRLLAAAGGDTESAAIQAVAHHPSGLGKRSLASHCETEGIEIDQALERLAALGVKPSPDSTLKVLAAELGTTPAALADVLQEPASTPGLTDPPPPRRARGR